MPNYFPKKIITQLLSAGKRLAQPFSLNQEKAYRQQLRTLKKLLLKAENTKYGKKFNFSNVLNSKFVYK